MLGYGATAINPYLVFETIQDQIRQGALEAEESKAIKKYVKVVNKGVVKILSKMGISTIRGYLEAQIFETLGISETVIGQYFTGTIPQLGGIGLHEIAHEALIRHEQAFSPNAENDSLEIGQRKILASRRGFSRARVCRRGKGKIFR